MDDSNPFMTFWKREECIVCRFMVLGCNVCSPYTWFTVSVSFVHCQLWVAAIHSARGASVKRSEGILVRQRISIAAVCQEPRAGVLSAVQLNPDRASSPFAGLQYPPICINGKQATVTVHTALPLDVPALPEPANRRCVICFVQNNNRTGNIYSEVLHPIQFLTGVFFELVPYLPNQGNYLTGCCCCCRPGCHSYGH